MNKQDTFEAIAKDAVALIITIAADLASHDDEADKMAAAVIRLEAGLLCDRAIALGGV